MKVSLRRAEDSHYRWIRFRGARQADEGHTRLANDPVTSPVVRRIYREMATGASLRSIARGLDADGIKTPMKKDAWSVSALRLVLRDPAYKGEAYAWKNGGNPIQLPDGTIPPLVDAGTWTAANRRLDRNKRTATRRNANPEASLLRAGFLVCGVCGRTMSVQNSGTGGQAHYRCINNGHHIHLRRDELDEAVVKRIRWLLNEDAVLEGAPDASDLNDPTEELDLLDRMIASVDRKRANLTDSIMDTNDADSRNVLLAQLDQLSQRHRALQDERDEAARHVERYQASREIIDGFDEWRRKVAVVFEKGTYQERRDILHEIGLQVLAWPIEHDPRWQIKLEILPSIVFSSPSRCSAGWPCPCRRPAWRWSASRSRAARPPMPDPENRTFPPARFCEATLNHRAIGE